MTADLHDWALEPREAIALQKRLASQLETADRLPREGHRPEVERIAGVDIGFEDGGAITRAAVVVLAWPGLAVLEEVVHREPTRFPYVPGLLAFRELPAALAAFSQLLRRPDLVMVDGQGIAHPRRLGIAAHLGLWLDLPTLGIAKKRLCGRHGEVPDTRGDWTPLLDDDEVIGAVLRSRLGVKPVYVSPGHRLSLASAVEWTVACLGRTKLPEPTRLADRLASRRGRRAGNGQA
ncbi:MULTISPECIES: deoxyribonuclease V [Halomonadaceae]|uniref:deoxyribonuclease V n=1 Tax=Halomonadaceae TaxID=28256 RepID=UPI000DD40A76|nr:MULTISPECIES: deoxyribonuclease V [Halomonas]